MYVPPIHVDLVHFPSDHVDLVQTAPLSHVIAEHDVEHHLYANDTQIHISLSGSQALESLTDLKSCVTDVFTWMTNAKLKLNPSKTEFIILGSKKQRDKFKDLIPILLLDHDTRPKAFVRNLGFIFDCDFNFKRQISQTCKICFYHIRDFRRIRKLLSLEAAKSAACALVTSHLDYCNSLLYNLPDRDIERLQRVQNCLARVVCKVSRYSRSKLLLNFLHWLPVKYRIRFKLCTITFKVFFFHQPTYLFNYLVPLQNSRLLRSSNTNTLTVPRFRTTCKTEFIILGSKKQRDKFKDLIPILLLDHDTRPKAFVRNLGFIFDCDFNFKRQISQTCKICFYHIRDFRRIRKLLSLEAAKSVACALVTSNLDYCNSLLYNLPDRDIERLQRVQNCLARVVCKASRYSRSKLLLNFLHWLPVKYRIGFKLCTITFKVFFFHQPTYLFNYLVPLENSRLLRSSNTNTLTVPRFRTTWGSRAFAVGAPSTWNSLPVNLRTASTVISFKKILKNFLFNPASPPPLIPRRFGAQLTTYALTLDIELVSVWILRL